MEELILELKEQIIEVLNLEELTPEDIDPKAPLFGAGGLGLDSIDALELIGKSIFTSVENIAQYVSQNRKK